jgi:hypothetical protein
MRAYERLVLVDLPVRPVTGQTEVGASLAGGVSGRPFDGSGARSGHPVGAGRAVRVPGPSGPHEASLCDPGSKPGGDVAAGQNNGVFCPDADPYPHPGYTSW